MRGIEYFKMLSNVKLRNVNGLIGGITKSVYTQNEVDYCFKWIKEKRKTENINVKWAYD